MESQMLMVLLGLKGRRKCILLLPMSLGSCVVVYRDNGMELCSYLWAQ